MMDLIDFILNLAGLSLWLNWLSIRFDPLTRPTAATLVGTLRKASRAPAHRLAFIAGLVALLHGRGFFYWAIGSAIDWSPCLRLVGNIQVYFPLSAAAYYLGLMTLYSVLSFGKLLVSFYVWLLLLSFLGERGTEGDPLLRLARAHLGPVARWPWPGRLVLPLLGVALAWLALEPLLAWVELVPKTASWAHRLEQATLIGAGAYLSWQYLIGGLLALHILNSYVYLGSHAFLTFVTVAAQSLLKPLQPVPLQLSKVDFAPLVAVAMVFAIAEFGTLALTRLYGLLPL